VGGSPQALPASLSRASAASWSWARAVAESLDRGEPFSHGGRKSPTHACALSFAVGVPRFPGFPFFPFQPS
jgi:hypothetical protein